MPHIQVDEQLPGIRALLAFSPATAAPIGELADLLLRSDEGMSRADRELIAAYVSLLNDCFYCHHSHAEIAICYLDGDRSIIEQIRHDYTTADISKKLKSLLTIAGEVQKGGKHVTEDAIQIAKQYGASDKDIHDTVLIAALFCMFNRYVDGLAANTPTDLSSYPPRARQVAEKGYGSHVYTTPPSS